MTVPFAAQAGGQTLERGDEGAALRALYVYSMQASTFGSMEPGGRLPSGDEPQPGPCSSRRWSAARRVEVDANLLQRR